MQFLDDRMVRIQFHDAALFWPSAFAFLQQALQMRTIFMLLSYKACRRIHKAAGCADLFDVFIKLFLASFKETGILFLFLLDLLFDLLLLLVCSQANPSLGY